MSDTRVTPYHYLNDSIMMNVQDKFLSFHDAFMNLQETDLMYLIEVYTDNPNWHRGFWESLLPFGFLICIRTEFPLIPLPDNYHPAHYGQYEKELRHYIQHVVEDKRVNRTLLNLGSRENPKMNLILGIPTLKDEAEVYLKVRPHIPEGDAASSASGEASSDMSSSHLSESNPDPYTIISELFSRMDIATRSEGDEEFREHLMRAPFTTKNSSNANEELVEPNREITMLESGVAGLALVGPNLSHDVSMTSRMNTEEAEFEGV